MRLKRDCQGNYSTNALLLLFPRLLSDFPIRLCNVVDPFNSGNNLGRGITRDVFERFKGMLRVGCQHMGDILEQTAVSKDTAKAGQGAMRSVFWSTLQIYGCGDGWRPDLLVHPCQSWSWSREESFDREKDLAERLSIEGGEYLELRKTPLSVCAFAFACVGVFACACVVTVVY